MDKKAKWIAAICGGFGALFAVPISDALSVSQATGAGLGGVLGVLVGYPIWLFWKRQRHS
jgi:hypothetical protein